ncbi:hypothetical protein GS918_28395 [Rhodococcus hoagii]|nr:hypothetical protein [Prescottella equi]
MVDTRSARVRATGHGWTVSTPTGRTVVADSLTAMWSAVASFAVAEPDWSALSLPTGFPEPAPWPTADDRSLSSLAISRRHADVSPIISLHRNVIRSGWSRWTSLPRSRPWCTRSCPPPLRR